MSRAFTAVPGGKRTVTLARQKHEAPRHLFRRGLWSLGRRWRFSRRVTGAIAAPSFRPRLRQGRRDVADQSGGGSSSKGEADARCHLDDAGHQASKAAG